MCVSSAQERGGGGERQRERERERERVPRLEQMPPNRLVFLLRPTDIVDPPVPPPPPKKKNSSTLSYCLCFTQLIIATYKSFSPVQWLGHYPQVHYLPPLVQKKQSGRNYETLMSCSG